ncbi:hypothetical protein IM792_18230 [Mucilaginibacter sp. JRF]|uniref:hypothetical protein n=1 Tax=Mucilaginibacter sp. JRF TaxID=2780088 RepID=UPI00187EE71C|nr:hypothetical protein [Mucilaginibacter sp. JRF]MBE9586396.1 hypothetical protein [Mucilaginibacter sp. JRF]
MTLTEFETSLKAEQPNNSISIQLQSLWYDGKGDWHKAHSLIDHLTDRESAWVHAYLHRKEGDIWNADYWYSKAGKNHPALSLQQEWEQLVAYFI